MPHPDDPTVGATGRLIMPTRGPDGPGEVLLRLGGGTEAFIAWSEAPLASGTAVLVYNSRGNRSVDVMQFGDDENDLGET